MGSDTVVIVLTTVIVSLSVALGIGLPMVALHLELLDRRERRYQRELVTQRELLAEREATIAAYRQLAHEWPAVALRVRESLPNALTPPAAVANSA